MNFVQNIFAKWKPILIGIESVQYQVALVQQARRFGIPIKELRADRDKVARSLSIATFLDSGLIYLNQKAPWLDEFINELIEFPNGRHDDEVDTFAYIAHMIVPVTQANVFGSTKKFNSKQISLFEQFF
ncbi:MAG: phage terminase large subunit [Candidatus Kapaibacteriales bacterium]